MDKFKELTTCNIGSGKSISLWTDKWGEDDIAELTYPHLHSFAKEPNSNVYKALNETNIYNLFQLPLSHIAHQELQDLRIDLENATTDNSVDAWNFEWSSPIYSTKKVYRQLIGEHHTHPVILDIWKTCNLPRQKFFAWLLMNQRLNTKDLMTHKHFYVEFNDCVLCDNCPQETLMHLFFECNYSQAFWWALNIEWDTDRDLHDMISEVKRRYSMEFIMEIIITGCWAIWDQRNNKIFNQIRPTIPACIAKFKIYCSAIMHRARPSLKDGMQAWLDTL
jgi:hypothetical protein